MAERTPAELEFEREKFQADKANRERELDIQERDLNFKISDTQRARWSNPLASRRLAITLTA